MSIQVTLLAAIEQAKQKKPSVGPPFLGAAAHHGGPKAQRSVLNTRRVGCRQKLPVAGCLYMARAVLVHGICNHNSTNLQLQQYWATCFTQWNSTAGAMAMATAVHAATHQHAKAL
jgi:hypothetical protein